MFMARVATHARLAKNRMNELGVAALTLLSELHGLGLVRRKSAGRGLREDPAVSAVGVELGGVPLITPMDQVHGIVRVPRVTRVPGCKPWVVGIGNVRGRLVTVIDLHVLVHGDRSARSGKECKLLMASGSFQGLGLLVERITGQKRYFRRLVKPASRLAQDNPLTRFVKFQVAVQGAEYGLLDLNHVLSQPDCRNAAA